MKPFNLIVALVILMTFICIPLAIATDDPKLLLITDLYKNHPPNNDKYWLDNKEELAKYFTNRLTSLFIEDDKCKTRTGGVCNLDF